ncbi:hypothetical protein OJF2_06600 [Aquisphaera giovannonii]|uniref:Uncharacterized protein n=1 Tax=Aquisphaera giovannonii TaxID=406548 RepID=A0A5B9VWF0_9BACT|nr:hypothetical protein [Aquisphaera giovannonii]QEH32191.1 hypothetical protein OJF2_06600 [Aquisphaera giovannonii]
MAWITCPYCGRRLPSPQHRRAVTCDGCRRAFDPAKVRMIYPPAAKQVLGWILVLGGMCSLAGAYLGVARLGEDNHGAFRSWLGRLAVALVLIFVGVSLKAGRLGVEGEDATNGPGLVDEQSINDPVGETWEAEEGA